MFMIILFCIFAAIIYFCFHMGIFSEIVFTDQTYGPLRFCYRNYVGPYSGIGPTFEAFQNELKEMKAETLDQCIGIYFDNPNVTPAEKCRAYVGVLLPVDQVSETAKPKGLMGSLLNSAQTFVKDTVTDVTSGFSERGIKIKSIPQFNAKVTKFPFRNMLSFWIGAMRVYSAAKFDFVCAMEITGADSINYVFPLDNNQHFVHEN